MQVNRNIHLCKEKVPIYKLSRSQAPKTPQICITTDMQKKNQWTFLLYNAAVDFSSRNNFANLGSFAKISVPVQTIIP